MPHVQAQGKLVPAVVVDHIVAHRGNEGLFWDVANWQSLCRWHHDSTKRIEERSGRLVGSDADGRPLSPKHPWNKARDGGV